MAVGVAALSLLAGCGGSSSSAYRATAPREAKKLLVAYLDGKRLAYRWVACLHTGRSFRAAAIVRCNVNFGDPHIEAYCSIVDRGRLVTNHETPSFACPADLRGWTTTVVTGP